MLATLLSILLPFLRFAAPPATPPPVPSPPASLRVLEAKDPANDQECVFHSPCPYPGGDLKGARLILKEVPVARSAETSTGHPQVVYVPVSLEIDLDRKLRGGETQLCVFVSLPPLYLEHVIVRNAISRKEANGADLLILLEGQEEFSFVTGLDPELDAGIQAFRESEDYRNCFSAAPPEKRREALGKAKEFSVYHGGKYIFSPSSFYWKEIPEMKISISLEVREGSGDGSERISHLISDALTQIIHEN